jgi:hypothetical protein
MVTRVGSEVYLFLVFNFENGGCCGSCCWGNGGSGGIAGVLHGTEI